MKKLVLLIMVVCILCSGCAIEHKSVTNITYEVITKEQYESSKDRD